MKATIGAAIFLAATSAAVVDLDARGRSEDKCGNLPLVDSKQLQDAIHSDPLLEGAKTLENFAYSTPGRNRQMGTLGHNLTTDYLVKELQKMDGYYNVEVQRFWDPVMLNGTGTLKLDGTLTAANIFDYSASGNVSAPLLLMNTTGCTAGDFPAGVAGKVVLIQRGACAFGLKSALAGKAGAAALLIYNNAEGIISGTLGLPGRPEGDYIPTLSLSQTQGNDLVASITGGATITASIDVVTDIQNRSTLNVIATTSCGNTDSLLMLGAHTDSVFRGPGINDDGSGTLGILEVAKSLEKYKVNNAVRFGWWSGEEIGAEGSTHYVTSLRASEQAKIRAYLNFDMIASPNYVYAIYDGDGSTFGTTGPAGSAEIEHFFEAFYTASGENFTSTALDGRSDYGPFLDINVPIGGTFTGAAELKTAEDVDMFGGTAGAPRDPNYHQAGDTVANLNMAAFTLNTKAIAAAVAEYAVSFDSLPPKGTIKGGRAAATGKAGGRETKYTM